MRTARAFFGEQTLSRMVIDTLDEDGSGVGSAWGLNPAREGAHAAQNKNRIWAANAHED